MRQTSPRNQIFLFLTFAISWTEEYFIVTSAEGSQNYLRILPLMWTPGCIGLALSWFFGYKFKDIGFRFGDWRNYVISYAVPVLTAILILGLLVFGGLGEFEIRPSIIEKAGGLRAALVKIFLIAPFFNGLIGFGSALGEEIGWRGFLHSKMIAVGIPHPFLISGFIWSMWHWPMILFSDYATSDFRFVSVALFTVMAVSCSVFMGWMRARSGSVFTAALIHAAHNLWIQGMYPAFLKKGPLDQYFGGESGIFNAVIYLLLAVFIYRKFLINGRPREVFVPS